MRPIKFRGRVPDSDNRDGGKIVFGSLVDHGETPHGYRYWIYPLEGDRNYPVEPDSVAQLVGYDANGKEVYEGDTIVDKHGGEWKAIIYSSLTLPFETDNGDLTVWGQGVTLKGGDQ